jgi:hypothetical protein
MFAGFFIKLSEIFAVLRVLCVPSISGSGGEKVGGECTHQLK